MKTITIDGVEYNLTPIEKQPRPIILEQTLKFEVYPQDLGESTWTYAKIMCNELDDGWRLPTKEELHIMYLNKNEIGVLPLPTIGVLVRTITATPGIRTSTMALSTTTTSTSLTMCVQLGLYQFKNLNK